MYTMRARPAQHSMSLTFPGPDHICASCLVHPKTQQHHAGPPFHKQYMKTTSKSHNSNTFHLFLDVAPQAVPRASSYNSKPRPLPIVKPMSCRAQSYTERAEQLSKQVMHMVAMWCGDRHQCLVAYAAPHAWEPVMSGVHALQHASGPQPRNQQAEGMNPQESAAMLATQIRSRPS